jgi:SAM-dependent methyltransferase
MLAPKLMDILACPFCKGSVKTFLDKLRCDDCNKEFRIINGKVPCFLGKDLFKSHVFGGGLISDDFYSQGLLNKLMKYGSRIITSEFRINKKIYDTAISGLGKNEVAIEIGAGKRRISSQFITLDIFPFESVDIVSDAHSLPLKEKSVDFILLDAVLEHVKEPWRVADECCRVLKSGGRILCIVPFMHHFHAYPEDYFRFTTSGIKSLFEKKLDVTEVTLYGGPSVAMVSAFSEYVTLFTFSKNNFINAFVRALALTATFPLKYLDYFLVKNKLATKLCSTILLVAKKSNSFS